MDHSKKHILIINSKDKLGSSASEYDADFKLPSDCQQCHHIQFKEMSFTNLLYNITSSNNRLDYEFNALNSSVTITPGYYDLATLTTALNSAQSDLVFTANNVTKKYDVTSVSASYIRLTGTINKVIGFTTLQTASTAYSGNQPFNLIRTNYIHVLTEGLADSDNVLSSDGKRYGIIASVPLTLPYGYVVTRSEDKDSSDESIMNSHINLSLINIKLVDDDFNVIENNGGGWVLSFCVYRR